MPRRPRVDQPGRFHHVMNRGLARRTVFENRADVRRFLALLARAAREKRLEIHAFAILTSHYHLLVRSLDGRISETLRRVQNTYVRAFNRTRRRDGPLFRGRFRSIPVETDRYLQTLVRYIDQNALEARLVARPIDFPYGSARHHVATGPRPRWLARTLIDRFLTTLLAQGVGREEAYERFFAPSLSVAERAFLERRLTHPDRDPEHLHEMVRGAREALFALMTRKSRKADGTRPGLPQVAPEAVTRLVATHRRRAPGAVLDVGPRRHRSVWDLIEVALLRDLAGQTFSAVGTRCGASDIEARRRYLEHHEGLANDVGYRGIAVEIARRVVDDGTSLVRPDDGRPPDLSRSCTKVS